MSSTLVFLVPQGNTAQHDLTATAANISIDSDASSSMSLQTSSLSPVFSQSLEYVPRRDRTAPISPPRSSARALAPRKGSPGREMHIPRPRNPFMIYRSEVYAQAKITSGVERDHRHISRIIGHLWNQLSEDEKAPWRLKAEQEKIEHQRKYPGYRFTPGARAIKPVKRNVKRNGSIDLARCKKVAELLMEGKQGDELESAVQIIDATAVEATKVTSSEYGIDSSPSSSASTPAATSGPSSLIRGWAPKEGESEEISIPLFRSPLLPPKTLPPNLDIPQIQSLSDPLFMDALQPNTPPADAIASSYILTPSAQAEQLQHEEFCPGLPFAPDAVMNQGQQSFPPHMDMIAPANQFQSPDYGLFQTQATPVEYQDCAHSYPPAPMMAPIHQDTAFPSFNINPYDDSLLGTAPDFSLLSSLDFDALATDFINSFDSRFSALSALPPQMSETIDPSTWDLSKFEL